MIHALLAGLLACTSAPAPPPPAASPTASPPTPQALADELDAMDFVGSAEDPLVRACPASDLLIEVRTLPASGLVYVGTRGWAALHQTDDAAAVVRLLTQVATLNHDLPVDKLSLDAETGEFTVSRTLVAATWRDTFATAVHGVCVTATHTRPALTAAR